MTSAVRFQSTVLLVTLLLLVCFSLALKKGKIGLIPSKDRRFREIPLKDLFRKIAPKESTLPRTTIPSRVPLTRPSRAPSSSSLPHHPLPSSSLSSRARRRRPSRRCRLQLLPSPPWLPPRRHRGGEHRRGASRQRCCGHRPRRAPARGQ